MIKSYVSSDENDSDDYDFGYSEPLVKKKDPKPSLSEIQSEKLDKISFSLLTKEAKIEEFFENINLGNLEVLEALVEAGVSVDCTDTSGWTPLLKACAMGNVAIVKFLLKQGADPDKRKALLTPLMVCCTVTSVSEKDKLKCVNLLLDHGAEVNLTDKYSCTALMLASGGNYKNIVKRLLAVPGININAADKEGWTALFYAVKSNSKAIIKLLKKANCSVNVRDKLNRTPFDLALELNCLNVFEEFNYVKLKQEKINWKTMVLEEPDNGIMNEELDFTAAIKKIRVHLNNTMKINFFDLLTSTDKDLVNFGIKLGSLRKILLSNIHKYHLHPWKKSSMPEIDKNDFSLDNAVMIVGSAFKHLLIANSSLKYVEKRAMSRLEQNKGVDVDAEEKIIGSLVNTYETAYKVYNTLVRINKSIKKIKTEPEGDYIGPPKAQEHSNVWLLSMLSYTGLAVWCYGYFKYLF